MTTFSSAFVSAIICYTLWGLFPIYWYYLKDLSPMVVLANRVIWSTIFLSIYFYVFAKNKKFNLLSQLGSYFLSAVSLAINWGVYIWAVNNGHVLAASMGYFLAPLFYVAAGCLILKEKLSVQKLIAFTCCVLGVIPLIISSQLLTLTIAMLLAVSIVFYAFFRKKGKLSSIQGLYVESIVMLPAALIYLSIESSSGFICNSCSQNEMILLAGSGLVTLVPLLFFGFAVKSLPFTSLAFLQYIAPIIQFLLGIVYFLEPINNQKLMAFIFVWIGMFALLIPAYKKNLNKSVVKEIN